jgi:hypothetical protein
VDPQAPIGPEELRGMMFVIADIGESVDKTRHVLEDAIDGQDPEDDS